MIANSTDRSLRAEGLCKSYGKRTVVSGVSLALSTGQVIGLLGPNGAGKTTTFYMVVGLTRPDSGHVFLDDEDITDFPMHLRAAKESVTCRRRLRSSASFQSGITCWPYWKPWKRTGNCVSIGQRS